MCDERSARVYDGMGSPRCYGTAEGAKVDKSSVREGFLEQLRHLRVDRAHHQTKLYKPIMMVSILNGVKRVLLGTTR